MALLYVSRGARDVITRGRYSGNRRRRGNLRRWRCSCDTFGLYLLHRYLSRSTSLGKEKFETWGEIPHLQSLAHGLNRSISSLPRGRNWAGNGSLDLKKFSSDLVEVCLYILSITFLAFLSSRMGQPKLPAWPGPQIMPNLPFAQWIAWFSYMMNRVSVGTSFPPSLQMLR